MGECNSIGKTPSSVTTESETWGNVGEVSDKVVSTMACHRASVLPE
jgi:hypothetical protein